MNKEEFVIKDINEKVYSAFDKTWKELLNERKGDYEIVDNDLHEEAFILFTAGYMSCYTDVKKIQKDGINSLKKLNKTPDKIYVVCEYYENTDCQMKENYKPVIAFKKAKHAIKFVHDMYTFPYKTVEIAYKDNDNTEKVK